MKSFRNVLLVFVLFLLLSGRSLGQSHEYSPHSPVSLTTDHFSDNIISVHLDQDRDHQLAINTDEGIIVFNSHWGPGIEGEYRKKIKETFSSNSIKYVVNTSSRIYRTGGNAFHKDALIIAPSTVYQEMLLRNDNLEQEIQREYSLFTNKADRSRNILKQSDLSADDRLLHKSWMDYCQLIADDLSRGYEMTLPSIVFNGELLLDMGDLQIHLDDFAGLGLIVWIPREKYLQINGLFYPLHILVVPQARNLDVEKLISKLEHYMLQCSDVKQLALGYKGTWPLQKLEERITFIKHLWKLVNEAKNDGKSYEQMKNAVSLDNEFRYIKEWDVYKSEGHEWVTEDLEKIFYAFWHSLHQDTGV